MPEGPSIVILKEAVELFTGKKIIDASGNSTKIDYASLKGLKILSFKSWGKHFLICFKDFTIRIHLLMFGSYRINEEKDNRIPRLSLQFAKGKVLNFYACAVSVLEQPLDKVYDWRTDVMNKTYNEKLALEKLKAKPETLVCEVLLDQQIFSGVGNIIKNEVLFRLKIHPKSKVGKIPLAKRKALVKEVVTYSFQFLEWKKEYTLKQHWLAHTKKVCTRDQTPLTKKYFGASKRRSFFCKTCQKLYA